MPWIAADDGSDLDRFYILTDDLYSETYTFFCHSPGGTWHGDDVAVILWLVAHPWVFPTLVASPFALWLAIAVRRRRLVRRRQAYAKLPGA